MKRETDPPFRIPVCKGTHFNLSKEQIAKLEQLAKFRKRTPEQCIKDFIDSCQPGGSGWKPPCG